MAAGDRQLVRRDSQAGRPWAGEVLGSRDQDRAAVSSRKCVNAISLRLCSSSFQKSELVSDPELKLVRARVLAGVSAHRAILGVMAKRSKTDQAAFDLAVDQLGGGAAPERPPTLRRRPAKRAVKSSSILELAQKASIRRYHELAAELAELLKAFPHLQYGSAVSPAMPDAAEEPKIRRRHKTPAAARKRISDAPKPR